MEEEEEEWSEDELVEEDADEGEDAPDEVEEEPVHEPVQEVEEGAESNDSEVADGETTDDEDGEEEAEEEARESDSPVSSLASQLGCLGPGASGGDESRGDSPTESPRPEFRPTLYPARKKESPWARLRQKLLGKRPGRAQLISTVGRTSLSNDSSNFSIHSSVLDSPCDSEGGSEESSSPSSSGLPFFIRSPFPYVPPTIRFALPSQKVRKPKRSVLKHLRWCHNSLIPKVVRRCLLNSHFQVVHERNMWIGYWGKHLKTANFRSVLPYQKVNHFPGTFHMGRKDRLWSCIRACGERFGWAGWDLMPRTFCLPRDARRFRAAAANEPARPLILKPPASARGAGIRVVSSWSGVPTGGNPVVVQDYVIRPFLVNGSKFDLRLYVYITSFDPLRIYLNEDGLVRFASLKSVRDLWRYFAEEGQDVRAIMESIVDLIIKAVISCEWSISPVVRANTTYPWACHELFGFDILLDEELKPWLLEANISPSLEARFPLDAAVKGPLARDVLNLAGLTIPGKGQLRNPSPAQPLPGRLSRDAEAPDTDRLDYRAVPEAVPLSAEDRRKRSKALEDWRRNQRVPDWILDNLLPSDIRLLVEAESEWERRGEFTRLFPSPFSHSYLPFFAELSYPNLLLHAWTARYAADRQSGLQILENLCIQKRHLQ